MDQPRSNLGDELSGRRIVLTAQRRAEQLASALERHGAQIVHAPSLSVIPHSDDPELAARTRDLIDHRPDIVVVTTGVGFTGWGEVAEAAGVREQWHQMLAGARIVARGPKARGAIQAAGLAADWVAESETSAEIEQMLLAEGVNDLRIAVQHHGAGADGLDEAFAAAGADVRSLIIYRWGPAPDPEAVVDAVRLVAQRRCDAVAFTSAPGAAAFLAVAEEQGLLPTVVEAFNEGVVAAAVGNVTAAPLWDRGIRTVIPERFRLGALARILVSELADSARGSASDATKEV
ncbi:MULTISPECIES: uroporphyrinogen-III synthase [unclassified Brevibacterium]|uniref:uroporphyrinogen-III synthase n=1 Tax=unclassified Brevibacterium TaxID=2614124 RepID=UPI00109215B5|nr:uroporphyrinogen-III synthase [Brevibacterium sp. S22]TGD32606.1 uroporphyrinogen-III synthase [Brevibacterium sp. S22]